MSSPYAYSDSNNSYVGSTRQINAYFYTKPALTANKYRVHVLQQWTTYTKTKGTGQIVQGSLENWSQVALTLYDTNGNLINGTTPAGRITSKSDKLDLVIYVKNPLSDGSLIQFSWGRQKFYSSDTDPKAPAWCQQVAMTPWTQPPESDKTLQLGGQRQFDCWYDPKAGA